MRIIGLLTAVAAALSLAGAAEAKDCGPALEQTGHALELKTPLDEPVRLGLAWSLYYGLNDPTDHLLARISQAQGCALKSFTARGRTFGLYTGFRGLPPRWATSPDDPAIAYLASAPTIEEGFAASGAGTNQSLMVWRKMYVLVVARGRTRHLVRLYDGVPDVETLSADMAAALDQRSPVIADFDPARMAVSFEAPTRSASPTVFLRGGGPRTESAAGACRFSYTHDIQDRLVQPELARRIGAGASSFDIRHPTIQASGDGIVDLFFTHGALFARVPTDPPAFEVRLTECGARLAGARWYHWPNAGVTGPWIRPDEAWPEAVR